MTNKSTYFSILLLTLLILPSCATQGLTETNYSADTKGYNSARYNSVRNEILKEINQNNQVAKAVQNPNTVPVIINDPYATSNIIANNNMASISNGLGRNSFYQNPNSQSGSNRSYSSLANTEEQIISPNVFIQNSNSQRGYQQPVFGSNYYRPY